MKEINPKIMNDLRDSYLFFHVTGGSAESAGENICVETGLYAVYGSRQGTRK